MNPAGIQEMRARWEQQKWTWRWLVVATGVLGFLIVFFTARSLALSLFTTAAAMVTGALGWQLLISASQALLERLRLEEPVLAAKLVVLASLVVLVELMVVASAPLALTALLAPALTGGAVLAFIHAWLKHHDVQQPHCFVEIENSGDVLMLKKGALLLTALEAAGYKLITQCEAQGDCATCRIRVLQKNQQFADKIYGPLLTPRQKNEGWAIACQVPVEADMKIRLYKPLMLSWPVFSRHELTSFAKVLRQQLPGFDCEACGYNTCDQYALAISLGKAAPDGCFPGGEAVTKRLRQQLEKVESVKS